MLYSDDPARRLSRIRVNRVLYRFMKDPRRRRHLHGLTADGMVACNPRDREAAHRAQNEGIATADLSRVTCPECRTRLFRARRQQ